jgi:hypothetical protein
MFAMRQLFLHSLALLACCCSCHGEDPAAFAVQMVSPRPARIFADDETADIRVRLSAAPAGEVVVAYRIQETDGSWTAAGDMRLVVPPAGGAEQALPIAWPGRGLYQVSLEASAGAASAKAEGAVAIVFPASTDRQSPWGLINVLFWPADASPEACRQAALAFKLMGAAWVRYCFWGASFDTLHIQEGDAPAVTADYPLSWNFARALHAAGIRVAGNIVQCPRALSSRSEDDSQIPGRDCGPMWCRVKPRDYRTWDRFMHWLAADLAGEIQMWEIWNEPQDSYWSGTRDEFLELIEHTSASLRRGNPTARIAGCSFVQPALADELLAQGLGRHIDILTVHYVEEGRDASLETWNALLAKHRLEIPIRNTEESSLVPLKHLAAGVPFAKFGAAGYDGFTPLIRAGDNLLPAAITYAAAAHCIGSGRFRSSQSAKGRAVTFFDRGEETSAVFSPGEPCRVELAAKALAGVAMTLTDSLGRSRDLEPTAGVLGLELGGGWYFLNGARDLTMR